MTLGGAGEEPFVGRARELERGARAVDRALGGVGSVLLFSGEAGLGKTRIAQTLAREAANRGIEATGKHAKVEQVHTFRMKDDKIVETWMVMDRLDMLTQLGALH